MQRTSSNIVSHMIGIIFYFFLGILFFKKRDKTSKNLFILLTVVNNKMIKKTEYDLNHMPYTYKTVKL